VTENLENFCKILETKQALGSKSPKSTGDLRTEKASQARTETHGTDGTRNGVMKLTKYAKHHNC
jgi:hypothetical protein